MIQGEIYNVALYVRLSEEDQRKKDSRSVENQKCFLMDYISNKPDFILYGIYEDVQVTGATFERPGFNRMMSDIKKGLVNCIIVKDLSRFARNYIDAGQYLEQIFPILGVRFIAINDEYDSANFDDNGLLSMALKNILNDTNLKETSARIISAFRARQQAGDYLGGIPPYGYLRSKEDPHKLIIDPVASKVVKQIFDWKFEGKGDNKIAIELNKSQHLPPKRYFYELGIVKNQRYAAMNTWHRSVIARILRHPIYIGDMYQHRLEVTAISSKRKKPVDPAEWIIVPNTHEPIISKEQFRKMQSLLEKKAEEQKAWIKKYEDLEGLPNLLKGLVFCGDCGRAMTRHKSNVGSHGNGVYYVYFCTTHEKVAPDICTRKSIRETTILSVLNEAIRTQIRLSGVIKKKNEELAIRNRQLRQVNSSEITNIKRNLSKSKSLKLSLYEEYVEGQIGRSEYAQRKKQVDIDIENLTTKLKELQEQPMEYRNLSEKDRHWVEFLQSLKRKRNFTADQLHALIKQILIYDNAQIEIVFNFAFHFGCEEGERDEK